MTSKFASNDTNFCLVSSLLMPSWLTMPSTKSKHSYLMHPRLASKETRMGVGKNHQCNMHKWRSKIDCHQLQCTLWQPRLVEPFSVLSWTIVANMNYWTNVLYLGGHFWELVKPLHWFIVKHRQPWDNMWKTRGCTLQLNLETFTFTTPFKTPLHTK